MLSGARCPGWNIVARKQAEGGSALDPTTDGTNGTNGKQWPQRGATRHEDSEQEIAEGTEKKARNANRG